MYLLDTNVLSAMMRADVEPAVATWLRGKPVEIMFTSAICQAEILAGLTMMADGRRQDALTDAARAMSRRISWAACCHSMPLVRHRTPACSRSPGARAGRFPPST